MVYFGGFFSKLELSRGFLYPKILFTVRISKPAMGGAGVGGYIMKYDNNRAVPHFYVFFSLKLEFPRGFLYIILILPKGDGGGGGEYYSF